MSRIYIIGIYLNRKYIRLQYAKIMPCEIVLYSASVHGIAISHKPRTIMGTQKSRTCILCLRETGWSRNRCRDGARVEPDYTLCRKLRV